VCEGEISINPKLEGTKQKNHLIMTHDKPIRIFTIALVELFHYFWAGGINFYWGF